MPKISNTFTSTVVTFLVTLLLNTSLNYYSGDKGAVSISPPITLADKIVRLVSIENYTQGFLDGLAIEVPSDIKMSDIAADSPIQLKETDIAPGQRSRIVKINQINPTLVTRIFFTAPNTASASSIRVLSAHEAGLTARRDDELESPLRKALRLGLIMATIYSLFSFALGYYFNKKIASFESNLEEIKTQVKKTKEDIASANTRQTKQRILLLARISDYAKELEFWRNTIRVFLTEKTTNQKPADDLINAVTESLQTFGTRSRQPDFDTIRIAAGWLRSEEEEATYPKQTSEEKT